MKVQLIDINRSFRTPEKDFNVNFTQSNSKLYLSSHFNADNNYLFVNRKEIFKFKADKENIKIPTQFYLGRISNPFSATESTEVSLNGNEYGFFSRSQFY